MAFISIKMELDFFACINFSAFERCSWKQTANGGQDWEKGEEDNYFFNSFCLDCFALLLWDCIETAKSIASDCDMTTVFMIWLHQAAIGNLNSYSRVNLCIFAFCYMQCFSEFTIIQTIWIITLIVIFTHKWHLTYDNDRMYVVSSQNLYHHFSSNMWMAGSVQVWEGIDMYECVYVRVLPGQVVITD